MSERMNYEHFSRTDRIKLFVYVPKSGIQVVSITKNSRVCILNQLFPGENKEFLYKGQILNKSLSIRGCSLQEGDGIVAISKDEIDIHNKFREITLDIDHFTLQLRKVMDPSIKNEQDRLMDIKLARAELKPSLYRKLRLFNKENETQTHITVIPNKIVLPTNKPLPVFW